MGGWLTPRPGRFRPGNDSVPSAQEAGWNPGPVWTGEENLSITGIGSPDHPAHTDYAIPARILRTECQ